MKVRNGQAVTRFYKRALSRLLSGAVAALAVSALLSRAPPSNVGGAAPLTDPTTLPSADGEIPEAPKLLFEHRLQVRRLVYDRVIFGLLLVLAGFLTNGLIETYKAKATQSQFYLDKRMELTLEIRRSLTEVVHPLFKITGAACSNRKESGVDRADLNAALTRFANTVNSSAILLDEAYTERTDRALNLLKGIADSQCYASCDVRMFISHVSQYVTDDTREQLSARSPPRVLPSRETSFSPSPWPKQQIERAGTVAYMEKNYSEWLIIQRLTPPAKPVCRIAAL